MPKTIIEDEMLVTINFRPADAPDDLFIEVDGQRIAKRANGRWKTLVKGWKVRDYGDYDHIDIIPPRRRELVSVN